jgi:hypothetical protein
MALQVGQSVFVTIAASVSLDVWAAALRKIPELGLVPIVYRGVPHPEGRIVSNPYVEARNAIGSCSVAVYVDSDSPLDTAVRFPSEVVQPAVKLAYMIFGPQDTAKFEARLEADLRQLMS